MKEGLERAGVYRKEMDFDARNLTPDEQIAKMATVPLAFQPGTTWNYSLSTDMLGRVVEKPRAGASRISSRSVCSSRSG